jgi:hypothetical protein
MLTVIPIESTRLRSFLDLIVKTPAVAVLNGLHKKHTDNKGILRAAFLRPIEQVGSSSTSELSESEKLEKEVASELYSALRASLENHASVRAQIDELPPTSRPRLMSCLQPAGHLPSPEHLLHTGHNESQMCNEGFGQFEIPIEALDATHTQTRPEELPPDKFGERELHSWLDTEATHRGSRAGAALSPVQRTNLFGKAEAAKTEAATAEAAATAKETTSETATAKAATAEAPGAEAARAAEAAKAEAARKAEEAKAKEAAKAEEARKAEAAKAEAARKAEAAKAEQAAAADRGGSITSMAAPGLMAPPPAAPAATASSLAINVTFATPQANSVRRLADAVVMAGWPSHGVQLLKTIENAGNDLQLMRMPGEVFIDYAKRVAGTAAAIGPIATALHTAGFCAQPNQQPMGAVQTINLAAYHLRVPERDVEEDIVTWASRVYLAMYGDMPGHFM